MDTFGALIDKLCTVDLKMWNNQEILYQVRSMEFDEFQRECLSTPDKQRAFFESIKKCCDLNFQRNQLIDELDQMFVAALTGKIDPKTLVQLKHKTYTAPGDDKLKIEEAGSVHEIPLAHLFEIIAGDESAQQHFYPHPFNEETAVAICRYKQEDKYFVGYHDSKIAAYMMLRGLDEGFENPSFGVYVAPDYRRRGFARQMLEFAIDTCKCNGYKALRLTVVKSNLAAIKLYEEYGFIFEPGEGDTLVGWKSLDDKGTTDT